MSLPDLLSELFEHGRVGVSQPGELGEDELLRADALLAEQELYVRRDFPGAAPLWSPPAARWAAVMFYRACQLAVYRELQVESYVAAPGPPAPERPADGACLASVHYSVDLVFRFLPDLQRLAHGVARQDPLLERIAQWGRDWPLSSVGMKDLVPQHVDGLVAHPGLLRYYADRVIARRDASRLQHEQVRAAVRQALGLYDALAPELAALCRAAETETGT